MPTNISAQNVEAFFSTFRGLENELNELMFKLIVFVDVPREKHVRGPTRGVGIQSLVDKHGKLQVPIPSHFRAPVGKHANKFASKIGIEIRTQLPDLTFRSWKAVDKSIKDPLIQRVMVRHYKFEILLVII